MTNAGTDASPTRALAVGDPQLSMLLDVVLGPTDESDEHAIGLSLVTTGGAIHGEARTRHVWAEGQTEVFEQGETISSKFVASIMRITEEEMQKKFAAYDGPKLPRRYIHLKNATVVNGDVRTDYNWLRVDVQQVVAWDLLA